MSSFEDFNKILHNFEDEIKNLKDITGAYSKMQNLIQLQIELSSKVDKNMHSIAAVIENQKELDLSKQLESLSALSTTISENFTEINNSINQLTANVQKSIDHYYEKINVDIHKSNERIENVINTASSSLLNRFERENEKIIQLTKDKSHDILSAIESSLKSTLSNNEDNLRNYLDEQQRYKEVILSKISSVRENLLKDSSDNISVLKDSNSDISKNLYEFHNETNSKLDCLDKKLLDIHSKTASQTKLIKFILFFILIVLTLINFIYFTK